MGLLRWLRLKPRQRGARVLESPVLPPPEPTPPSLNGEAPRSAGGCDADRGSPEDAGYFTALRNDAPFGAPSPVTSSYPGVTWIDCPS